MSAATLVSFRAPVLPWAGSPEDEQRFRRISGRVLVSALLLCIALPWLPVAAPEKAATPALGPAPLVKLVLDDKPPPPPPPAPVTAAPRTALPPTAEATPRAVPTPAKPQPVAQPSRAAPVTEARNPQPDKPPGEALDAARRRASGAGLLALKDELKELHAAPAAVQLKTDIPPGRGVGTGSGVGVGAGTEPGVPSRALITSNAAGGSGGINTAGYSRDTGGGGLAGRATTVVPGVAGGGGGGGAGGGGSSSGKATGAGVGAGSGGSLQRAGGGKASRSIEDVRLVFEKNKGAIYAIYNRALREEPGLQGKVVVELKISPAGQVVSCRVVSSELKAPELEAKLLGRIKQFDFGAKEVEQLVVTWPLDFLPS